MAILHLSSTNPNFSFIIRKNPSGIPFLRSIRKGHMVGWYTTEQSYAIWFKDGDDEISFKDDAEQEFEHISPNKYQDALAYASIMKEAFDAAMKEGGEHDTMGFTHTLEMNLLRCKNPGYFNIFERHHEHLTIDRTNVVGKSWNVKLTSTAQLSEFLNIVALFLLYVAVINDEHFYIDESMFVRYAESMKKVDSPYFLRYIFKSRIIESRKIFQKLKSILEDSTRHQISLTFGDTQVARKDFVTEHINPKYDIVDLGCGDGSHLLPIAKKTLNSGILIHAIDRDPDVLSIVQNKCKARGFEHVICHNSIEEFLSSTDGSRNHQVIVSEVIEHNELDELNPLLEQIKLIPRMQQLIITTPNRDFNVHYAMDNIFRHDDHKWEMNRSEFENTMSTAFSEDCSLKFFQVGDIVDGSSPTSGCIFRPHNHTDDIECDNVVDMQIA